MLYYLFDKDISHLSRKWRKSDLETN